MADRRVAGGVALAVLGGGAGALQSRVNGELGVRLHDGIAAAAVSFGSGLVLLALAVPLLPAGRRGLAALAAALRTEKLRWWQCLGGTCGALFVVGQGVSAAALGVAVFTVAQVAGQSASSLAVDRAGLGPAASKPLTGTRVAGAVLSVFAVVVAVSSHLGTPRALALAVLPAVAGVAVAWQQAVNGWVRLYSGTALAAAFVNFLAGCAALTIALAVDLTVRGAPHALPSQPWLYVGGAIGVAYIAVAASVVHRTGVLLLGLGTIAGQLVGAVVIDELLPGGLGRPGATTLAGTALTLVAVAIAALPDRRTVPA